MKYEIIKPKMFQDIQNQYQINSLLAKVIESRHLDNDSLQNYINSRLIYHDYSLFEESDMTLERIQEAIENEEKICIYGDYDCDGILATTILVQAFLELGVEVGYHIPNRFEDGYGLNEQRVKQMAEKGYSLIITVDNGVKAFDAVECANELGVDVIVTDHHQFDTDLPDAFSFIHTKLSPEYPFKEISGGYVAYKLAVALMGKQDKYLYCLAAITTVSDMMPLLDENRSLVKRALVFMQEEKYPALELLLGDQQSYTTTSLGFNIAPKVNSFGRLPELCNPNILVKYFLKNADRTLMMKVSTVASEINSKRQSLTNQQYSDASSCMNDSYLYYSSEDVHEGLVGLIAGKYTREYERPSFVMHYDKETKIHKGSARSVHGFSLHDFFTEHRDYLVTFGGHSLAGGFSVHQDHYEKLSECIKEALKDIPLQSKQDVLLIDENDLTIENIESLSLLEPFGMCNEEPLYYLNDMPVSQIFKLSEGKHLKIDIDLPSVKLSALLFNKGSMFDDISTKKSINIVGQLSINEFRNKKTINFIVKDIV
ncbi:MAG: single-stranded-DNA-specific exonuclease RecJ [Coprobacillus sp.]